MVELKLLDGSELEKWNKMVARCPRGTVFHTLEWTDALSEVFQVSKLGLGIYQGGELVGILPAFLHKTAIFKLLLSPLHGAGTPYGGPLVESELLGDTFMAWQKFAEEEGVHYIDVGFSPQGDIDCDILRANGYICERRFTYLLDLNRGVDSLWQRLDQKCRNMVRKSMKNAVKVVEISDVEQLGEYYQMSVDTYAKSHTKPILPLKLYRQLFETLHPKGMLKVLFAQYDGKLVAGAFFPCFDNRIYYWDGASYRDYYRVAPNNLIQWHLIEWAASHGFKSYDMLGANIPTIAAFKKGFGGELVQTAYAYRYNSPMARFGRQIYVWWMKIIKRI